MQPLLVPPLASAQPQPQPPVQPLLVPPLASAQPQPPVQPLLVPPIASAQPESRPSQPEILLPSSDDEEKDRLTTTVGDQAGNARVVAQATVAQLLESPLVPPTKAPRAGGANELSQSRGNSACTAGLFQQPTLHTLVSFACLPEHRATAQGVTDRQVILDCVTKTSPLVAQHEKQQLLGRLLRDFLEDTSRPRRVSGTQERVLIFWPRDYMESARASLVHVFCQPHQVEIAATFGVTSSTDMFGSLFTLQSVSEGKPASFNVLIASNGEKPSFVLPRDYLDLLFVVVDARCMTDDPSGGPIAVERGIRSLLPHLVGYGASTCPIHVVADPQTIHVSNQVLTERGWIKEC